MRPPDDGAPGKSSDIVNVDASCTPAGRDQASEATGVVDTSLQVGYLQAGLCLAV